MTRANTIAIASLRHWVKRLCLKGARYFAPKKAAADIANQKFYDERIDFFRGISLIFIFINHIPDNALSIFTSKSVALFDSAEVFVFLAGYSAALAYYKLVSKGLHALAAKAMSRARVILAYHVALLAIILALTFSLSEFGIHTGYEVFLSTLIQSPVSTIVSVPLLSFQAPLLDILPMYVLVMLLAPFLIWLCARSEVLLLLASAVLWLTANMLCPHLPTVTPGTIWNFNPLCWQFLFAIGLVFGWRTRIGASPIANTVLRPVLDVASLAVVLFSGLVVVTVAFQSLEIKGAEDLRALYLSLDKRCLDARRLLGLLATAYLVARVLPKNANWLSWRAPRWVCAIGASSLPIFALSVVLSLAGKLLTEGEAKSVAADACVSTIGVTIMICAGVFLRNKPLKAKVSAAVMSVFARMSAAAGSSVQGAAGGLKDGVLRYLPRPRPQ